MRYFDPQLAEIRFGYGLSPLVPAPAGPEAILAGLTTPDRIPGKFPVERFSVFRERMVEVQENAAIRRKNRGTELAAQARKRRNELNKEARVAMVGWMGQTMLRRTYSETAFRERLVAFWADHFTAYGKRGVIRRATTPYTEDAIRPFIADRFEDLLQSAVMHPVMLDFLDQARSIGPNSARALKMGQGKEVGLNENLAREVLELHTLGVSGPYTQDDVRQLAELFTGMTFQPQNGFKFRKDFAEPGAETVLGQTYAETPNAEAIRTALRDLAVHPATARHIAQKLAVHFVRDDPDPTLVDAIEAAYIENDGALMPVYQALLSHPAAWAPELENYKPPIDFMSSTMRSLAVPPAALQGQEERPMRRMFVGPLLKMGQPWEKPIGPDGWPEDDPAWITPQGLAERVAWAMRVPESLMGDLPDPRAFVDTALGGHANEAVRFAASAAESKSEAIGLILMSPAFQRR